MSRTLLDRRDQTILAQQGFFGDHDYRKLFLSDAAAGTTVVPDTAALVLTTFDPTVAVSANQTVTPAVASLILSTFAPTVTASDHKSVVPAVASLTLATFAPTITIVGAPVWTTPADTVSMVASPELKFTMPTLGSAMHFNLQLDTASTFDTGDLRDLQSNLDQAGWDFWNGTAWEAVAPTGVPSSFGGNEARHTVQTPLTSVTWFRRVRAGT
jgi:hypothetical protein